MLKNLLRYGMAGLMALAMFLSTLPGRALAANSGTRFSDVGTSSTFFKEVDAAANTYGYVGGYADGTFNPNGKLTNGAACKMVATGMSNVGGYPMPIVAQVGAFANSIAFIRQRAESLGKSSAELSAILDNPSGAATRGTLITILYAVTPNESYEQPSMRGMPPTMGGYFAPPFDDVDDATMRQISVINGGWNSRDVISGYSDNTVRLSNSLIRAHACAMISRYLQLRLLDVVAADWQQGTVSASGFNCKKSTPSAAASLLIAGLEAGWEYTGCNPRYIGFDVEAAEKIVDGHPHVMSLSLSRGDAFSSSRDSYPVEFLDVWLDGEYAVYSYDKWTSLEVEETEIVGQPTDYDGIYALITAPRNGGVTIQPAPDPVKIQPAPSDPSVSPVNPGVPEEREETTEITTTGGYSESWLRNRLNNSSWSDSDVPEMLAYYMVSVGFTDVTITKNVGGDYDGQRRISGEGGVILTIYVYEGTGSSYRAAGHGIIGVTAMTDHPTVADAVSEIDAVSGRVHILPHEPDMTIQPAPENTIDTTVTTAVPTAAHQGFMLGMAA